LHRNLGHLRLIGLDGNVYFFEILGHRRLQTGLHERAFAGRRQNDSRAPVHPEPVGLHGARRLGHDRLPRKKADRRSVGRREAANVHIVQRFGRGWLRFHVEQRVQVGISIGAASGPRCLDGSRRGLATLGASGSFLRGLVPLGSASLRKDSGERFDGTERKPVVHALLPHDATAVELP
jgi:hypothetical protein